MFIRHCSANVINKFAEVQNKRTAQARQIIPLDEVGREIVCSVVPNYMYVEVSGLHGDKSNQNGDFFRWDELLKYDKSRKINAYATWNGKDVLLNHNEIKVVGDICEAYPYLKDKSINMLMRTDTNRAWDVCESVRKGSITDVSMGTVINHSFCTICNNRAETEDNWCFLGDTEVTMGDFTRKPIASVEVGDDVFTHKGRKKQVIKKFVRTVNDEPVYEITHGKINKTRVTGNHEFLVIRKEGYGCGISKTKMSPCRLLELKVCGKWYGNKACSGSLAQRVPVWVKASDLKEGDAVLFSRYENIDIDTALDEEDGFFLGLYAAEGCIKSVKGRASVIQLTIHEDELGFISSIVDYAKTRGWNEPKVYRQGNGSKAIDVRIHDVTAVKWVMSLIHGNAVTKRLSDPIIFSKETVAAKFLSGLFEGDGWKKTQGTHAAHLSIVSKTMRDQTCAMLQRIGIGPSEGATRPARIMKSSQEKYKDREYRCNELYNWNFSLGVLPILYGLPDSVTTYGWVKYEDQYLAREITKIEKMVYSGEVYNIEVDEDNSYIANRLVVHNCNHLKEKKGRFIHADDLERKYRDKFPNGALACEDNRGVFGIEVSWITVGEGADPEAKVIGILAGAKGPEGKQFNSIKKANYSKIADAFYEKIKSKQL